jgi:hypothetical protein
MERESRGVENLEFSLANQAALPGVGTAVRSSAVSRRAKRRFGCVLVTHHEDTESVGSIERSGRIQRIDGDVVPVQIQKRKLRSADAGIEMRLLFQLADESARP